MKILLIDDSKSARYALRLQLQRLGVEVETADCAESGFEFLKTQIPDAILMDHMMPGLNGFEALDVIRAEPRTAAIPVVMCTSHEEPEFVTTANQKGVFGILPKSAAAEFLPEIIDRLHTHLATTAPAVPIIAPPPVAAVSAPAAAPQWSEATVLALIEERLNAQLTALLAPQLDALRCELNEKFSSEIKSLQQMQHRIETQLAERAALPAPTAAPPALTLAEVQTLVQAQSSRLLADTSELLKHSAEIERALILEQVAARWHELPPAPSVAVPACDEAALLQQANANAQQLVREAVAAALAAQPTPEIPAAAPASGAMYGLFALATVLGVGAAAAVYFVLTSAGIPAP